MKRLKVSDFTFRDLPSFILPAVYQDARDWLVSYLSKRTDVISLYEFGSVGTPGISDLDFCVVIDDEPKPGIVSYLELDNFDPLLRDLLDGGTLMVMRREDFSQIRIWDDVNLIYRYGEPIDSIGPTDDDLPYVELCRLLDWLPERIARLVGYIQMQVLSIRRVLRVLNSLSYSLDLLSKVIDKVDPRIDYFLKMVYSLRSRWFERPDNRHKDLLVCLQEGVTVGFEAIGLLANYIQECRFYFAEQIPKTGRLCLGDNLLFGFNANQSKVGLDRSLELSTHDSSAVVLPFRFYQHFAAYGLIGGLIGNQISRHLEPKPHRECLEAINPRLREILYRRMKLCNRMAEFLASFGFKRGLFKFGWFYNAVLRQYYGAEEFYAS